MENLAQYCVNIPLTFEGYIKKGIFKKKLVSYSFTVSNDPKTTYTCNARTSSRAFKKATKYVQKCADYTIAQMKERETRGEIMIIPGNVPPNGSLKYSKPFFKITDYKLGIPEIRKIKDWKDATMKELTHSTLSIHEFQEVFDQIKQKQEEE